MAEGGAQFLGLSLLQHKDQIGKLIKTLGARTMLDYGSGRGDAYKSPHKIHRDWGLKRGNIVLYDPSFGTHDKLPAKRFDLVVCSDVLEHVPGEDVDRFVGDLFNHAKLHVWASVCCRKAKKSFPNTDVNLHVTVKHFQWWQDTFNEIAPLFPGVTYTLVETP
jgi:hypothetical protein